MTDINIAANCLSEYCHKVMCPMLSCYFKNEEMGKTLWQQSETVVCMIEDHLKFQHEPVPKRCFIFEGCIVKKPSNSN